MRSVFVGTLAALAIAGTSLPAAAAGGAFREAAQAAWTGSDGASPHLHLARGVIGEDADGVRTRRRPRADDSWQRPRLASQARKAKHVRKHVRTSRQARKQSSRGRHAARRVVRLAVRPYPLWRPPVGAGQDGVASYYWQGQRVASGGWFNPNAMTAAHLTLPFGTRVRVTHLGNGRSVDVHINDRGPYIAGRIIDLSRGAAGVIGMHGQGIARVKVTVLGR